MSDPLDRLGRILALADNDGATEDERAQAMRAAEEMAAVLGVELAVARAGHADRSRRETPVKRQLKVGSERSRTNAYMVELFCAVAEPHDIIVTVGWRDIYVYGYGLPSDLAIAEALYGVAAVRMVADADAALRRGLQKTAGRHGTPVDGRAYRAHFYEGYRSGMLTRLWRARHAAIQAAPAGEAGQPGTDIVLRDKAREVREFYDAQARHWTRRGTWKPPQRDDYVRDAVQQGEASAAATNLQLDPGIGTGRRPAGLPAAGEDRDAG
jgi:hypothetical protein